MNLVEGYGVILQRDTRLLYLGGNDRRKAQRFDRASVDRNGLHDRHGTPQRGRRISVTALVVIG